MRRAKPRLRPRGAARRPLSCVRETRVWDARAHERKKERNGERKGRQADRPIDRQIRSEWRTRDYAVRDLSNGEGGAVRERVNYFDSVLYEA